MANVATYGANMMLRYLLIGNTAGIPAAWGIGLSVGSPSSVSGSEIASSPASVFRMTGAFSSANANTFINTVANTYGPILANSSISGIMVWDTYQGTAAGSYTADAGNLLFYGTLTTPRTVISGDQLVLASSALRISLS